MFKSKAGCRGRGYSWSLPHISKPLPICLVFNVVAVEDGLLHGHIVRLLLQIRPHNPAVPYI